MDSPPVLEGPYRSEPDGATTKAARGPFPLRPRELLAALGLVVVFDVAFYGAGSYTLGGLGLATLFVGAPLALFFGARQRRRSARLAAVAVALFSIALRSAIDPAPLAGLIGVGLIVSFALTLRRSADVPEWLASSAQTIAMTPFRLLSALAGAKQLVVKTRLARVRVLPIVVPLAVGLAFVAVFAAANPLVASGCEAVLDLLGGQAFPSGWRVVMWSITLVLGIALVRPSVALLKHTDAADESAEAKPTTLLVARNTMLTMNAVFAGYLVLEVIHLAGTDTRSAGVIENQAYAHEGVLWLTVALILLTGVVGVLFQGAAAHDPRARLARRAAYAWIGLGLLLALGTYARVAIHIAHSGLSDLRILGMLGTSLVVIGMLLVALKLHRRRTFAWLLRRQLDAGLIALTLYAVVPTHFIAAHVNVARIESGRYAPLLHLRAQARETESAAVMLPLLEHEDPAVRLGVAAVLEDELDSLEARLSERSSFRERDLLTPLVFGELQRAHPTAATILGDHDPAASRQLLDDLARNPEELSGRLPPPR